MNISNVIMNMMSRGSLEKLLDEEVQEASITGWSNEYLPQVERLQNYGFTSRPGIDAEVLFLRPGGSSEAAVVINAEHAEFRKKIDPFEAAVYTKFDNFVYLKADGSVVTQSGKKGVTVLQNADGKFSVKNQTAELITLLSELLQELSTATVATAVGPQPLMNAAKISAIKTKLDTFKV